MKKHFRLVILITAFVLLLGISSLASSNTYTIPELELDITIPSKYTVITKDTPANASIFSALGRTKEELIKQFETTNIYLNAVTEDLDEEVVVTMTDNGLSDFNLISDFSLEILASALVEQYTDYGITVSEYDVYQHRQTKFIKIYFFDATNSVYGIQYHTSYNNKAINFTLRSYKGSITSTQENAIESVVDSIKFEAEPLKPESGEDTCAFIYTDVDTGLAFTVPANWKQKELSEDRNHLDAKFVPTKEDGNVIIYGSSDVWVEIPSSEKVGYTREDFNNSAFTKSEIAEMFNSTADKISLVEYNGIEYYFGEMTTSTDVYGLNLTMTMTQAVHISDGWIYTFQFSGTSDNEYYRDFVKLMDSVQFLSNSNVTGIGSLDSSSSDVDNSSNSGVSFIVFLIILLCIIIPFIVYKSISKEEIKQGNTFNEENKIELTGASSDNLVFSNVCVKCGQSLPSDSVFCHICGAKIVKKYEEAEI